MWRCERACACVEGGGGGGRRIRWSDQRRRRRRRCPPPPPPPPPPMHSHGDSDRTVETVIITCCQSNLQNVLYDDSELNSGNGIFMHTVCVMSVLIHLDISQAAFIIHLLHLHDLSIKLFLRLTSTKISSSLNCIRLPIFDVLHVTAAAAAVLFISNGASASVRRACTRASPSAARTPPCPAHATAPRRRRRRRRGRRST